MDRANIQFFRKGIKYKNLFNFLLKRFSTQGGNRTHTPERTGF